MAWGFGGSFGMGRGGEVGRGGLLLGIGRNYLWKREIVLSVILLAFLETELGGERGS